MRVRLGAKGAGVDMMKFRGVVATAVALLVAWPSMALAGAAGFDVSLSRTQNMDGVTVPQVIVAIDHDRRVLDRAKLQGAIRERLSRAGVRPDLIELQSVATAAIQLAEARDLGSQTNCYETWCASVSVKSN